MSGSSSARSYTGNIFTLFCLLPSVRGVWIFPFRTSPVRYECRSSPFSFAAGDGSDETIASRLAAVSRGLVRLLERASLPDKIAKACSEWLALEVRRLSEARPHSHYTSLIQARTMHPHQMDQLTTAHLVELLQLIMGGLRQTLRSGGGGSSRTTFFQNALAC